MSYQLLIRQYPRMIGLARYTVSLVEHLSHLNVPFTCVEPAYPWPVRAADAAGKIFGKDLSTFLTTYPVAAPLDAAAVKHFTTQQMASLFSFKPGVNRVVVTVHDIIPYLKRSDPVYNELPHFYDQWMDQLAMHNLRKADLLMADSAFTGEMLVKHLSCSRDKIRVVLLGLDQQLFHPAPVSPAFLERYALHPDHQYLLYVGSENPRKNLPFLIQAVAKLQERVPNVKFLKVGGPENPLQRQEFKRQIADLHLEDRVIFLEHVPQEDLTTLYSAVDAFVFPSLYEGFGFPPLEAMACGLPVVCSTAASLPEIVGDAALTVDPHDLPGWVDAVERILLDDLLRADLRERGLARAREFTWERTARQTLAVYQELE